MFNPPMFQNSFLLVETYSHQCLPIYLSIGQPVSLLITFFEISTLDFSNFCLQLGIRNPQKLLEPNFWRKFTLICI